jgi:hypothetical protein
MDESKIIKLSDLPLEVTGYEVNSAVEVFVVTRSLDAILMLSLEAYGYVRKTNIELSDGKIIDGWVKV